MATSAEQDKAAGSSNESGDDVPGAHVDESTVTSIETDLANTWIRATMRESDPSVTEWVLCDICDTPKDAVFYCEECSINLCERCCRRHGREHKDDNSHHLSDLYCQKKAEALEQLQLVEDELVQLYKEEEYLQLKRLLLKKPEMGFRRERNFYIDIAGRWLRKRLEQIENEREVLQNKHAVLKHICQTPAEQLWKPGSGSANVLNDDTLISSRRLALAFAHWMKEYATGAFQSRSSFATETGFNIPEIFGTNSTQVTMETGICWPHFHPGSSNVQGAYPPDGRVSLPQTVPVDLMHLALSLRNLQHRVSRLQQTTTGLEKLQVTLVHEVLNLQDHNQRLMTYLSTMQTAYDLLRGTVDILSMNTNHLDTVTVSLQDKNASLDNRLAQLEASLKDGEKRKVSSFDCVAHPLEQDFEDGERETETNGQCSGGQDLVGSADQPEQTELKKSPCAEPQPTSTIQFGQDK